MSTNPSPAVATRACWTARQTERRAGSDRNPKPVPHLQQFTERLLAHGWRHLVQAEARPLVEAGQPLQRDAFEAELGLGARRKLEGGLRGPPRQALSGQQPLRPRPGCDHSTAGIDL